MVGLHAQIEMELVAHGGCIFCSNRGSGDHIKTCSITEQVENYFASYKANRANKFIAYFQNYTNTYDELENLKKKYNDALVNSKIVCLAVATRPDCINEEVCQLLASFKDKVDVWVELGLQTASDETGRIINRGYDSAIFTKAMELLNKYKIETIVHVMVGLPNETHNDIENTVKFLNKHAYQGIKIHSTYVIENTQLADLYRAGEYTPMTLEYYIENACYILTHISPDVVIHKISGDAPKELLIAPEWNLHKKLILNGIDRYLREHELEQGMFFKKSTSRWFKINNNKIIIKLRHVAYILTMLRIHKKEDIICGMP